MDRQTVGIEHIGDEAALSPTLMEGHQPDGMLGPVGPVRSQPDDGVTGGGILVEHLHQRVTGAAAVAADPRQALLGQIVEPVKGEVAQVEQQQAATLEPVDQGPCQYLLVLAGSLGGQDALPLLGAQVQTGGQFARQRRQCCAAWHPDHR